MRIALAQVASVVGDLEGNVGRCLAAAGRAAAEGAELVVLPEMAVPGYPPRDILLDHSFTAAIGEANLDLARQAEGLPPMVVGSVVPSGGSNPGHPGLLNAALLIDNAEIIATVGKRLLPAYDVFHENRWFVPDGPSAPVEVAGRKVGLVVCEDLWHEGYPEHPPTELVAAGAELVVCISASPYRRGVFAERLHHAGRSGVPTVLVNATGATDELVFDGRSFVTAADGGLLAVLAHCADEVEVVDLAAAEPMPDTGPPWEEELFGALVAGVRAFVAGNGLKRVFVGLSGGIDSSVAAVIACEAVGPGRVTGVAIPSRFTDARSTSSAQELAATLGMGFEVVELEAMHAAAEASLAHVIARGTTVAENIQARLRAVILMAYVNRFGGLLLNTSNKTEISLGYGTLYGDLAGSLSPLGDLTKPDVVALARWINRADAVIPIFVIERPPSAELKPDQVDPFDYPRVAPAMEELVLANRSNPVLRRSEHKRWQHGVILKVSAKAFGSGRMIPITRR